jgi:hypothetical protein
LDTDWIRIGYGLDTDWIRIGYGLDTDWIRIGYGLDPDRLRIESGFSDFMDPNPYWKSGSRIRIQGQENLEK